MFNEKFLFGFLNLGDDMYAYLATGKESISGISEGYAKKTFILPAPTDNIVVTSGSTTYLHLKVALQTPSGNSTEYSTSLSIEEVDNPRSRSTMFSGLFPQGTKIIVTDTDGYDNSMYCTCTYNTLTFYKVSPDFLGGD